MTSRTNVITREAIESIIEQYRLAMRDVDRGYDLLAQGQERLESAFGDRAYITVLGDTRNPQSAKDEAHERLARQAWRGIVRLSCIRKVISTQRERELNQMLDSGGLPPLTVESVHETLALIGANLNELAGETVAEAFNYLRPWGSRHKTNQRWFVPDKVILVGYIRKRLSGSGGWEPSRYLASNLRTIDRAFHLLDGNLAKFDESYRSPLIDAMAVAEGNTGRTTYFIWKAHKNGNLHLTFTRPDLVNLLNQYGGRTQNELPAGTWWG